MANQQCDDPAWPFGDPPELAVLTSWRILRGEEWCRYVSHEDEEGGGWQFHPSSGWTPMTEAALVSLRQILAHDATLSAVADLPLGWCAWRDGRGAPWARGRISERWPP